MADKRQPDCALFDTIRNEIIPFTAGIAGRIEENKPTKVGLGEDWCPMLLEPKDVQLFFRLHRTLMFFVNQRLNVIPNKITAPEEFAALSPEVRVKVRDALNAN